MKNALILHGMGNNHTGNWFPWHGHFNLEAGSQRQQFPELLDFFNAV